MDRRYKLRERREPGFCRKLDLLEGVNWGRPGFAGRSPFRPELGSEGRRTDLDTRAGKSLAHFLLGRSSGSVACSVYCVMLRGLKLELFRSPLDKRAQWLRRAFCCVVGPPFLPFCFPLSRSSRSCCCSVRSVGSSRLGSPSRKSQPGMSVEGIRY